MILRRHIDLVRPPDLHGGDIIRLSWERGRDGKAAFRDTGLGRTLWAGNDPDVARARFSSNNQNSFPGAHVGRNGSQTGYLGSATDYFTAPYTADNAVPLGDWFMGIWYYPGTANMGSNPTSSYVVSVQDSTASAAGTVIAMNANNANPSNFNPFLSDGTTRSLVASYAASILADRWNFLALEYFSGTLYTSVNGVVGASAAWAGPINSPPANAVWRIGNPVFPGISGYPECNYDMFQLKATAPYRGQSFSCPEPPNRCVWH